MSDVDVIVVNQNTPFISVTGTNLPGMAGPAGAKGEPGERGPRGYQLLHGNGAPPSTLGQMGDYYIDNTNLRIHGPKGGTWPAGRDIRGPMGPTGPVGPKGNTGPQGSSANVQFGGSGDGTLAAYANHTHEDTSSIITSSATMRGGSKPAGAAIITQAGTFVGTTANNGSMNVSFPSPFPNGLITVVANAGDNTPRGNDSTGGGSATTTGEGITSLLVKMDFTTLTSFRIAAYSSMNTSGDGSTGRYLTANKLIRVNYVAYGW